MILSFPIIFQFSNLHFHSLKSFHNFIPFLVSTLQKMENTKGSPHYYLIFVLWISIFGPSPAASSLSQITCPPGKVECGPDSEQCIPQDFMCDQLEDCSNGWDEMEQNCPCDGFSCPYNSTTTKCIPSYWVCDNMIDCPGGEDEVRPCPPCPPRHFRCVSDERCISTFFVCNGEKDCVDGSDEFICPSQTRQE